MLVLDLARIVGPTVLELRATRLAS
jgi:hypothetical protein